MKQTTFKVSPVQVSRDHLPSMTPKKAIEAQTGRRLEACSSYTGRLIAAWGHPLFMAAHIAFAKHRPLVLSPDAIWLTIATGLATHVDKHKERFRNRFVRHEGKLLLKVRRDDFVRGSPENPWGEVFSAFSQQIRGHLGEKRHDQLIASFSTTGPIERAATEVALMATVQSYFDFRFMTLCGIPEVTLTGEVEDWERLKLSVAKLGEFDLGWWTKPLARVMDEFVAAAKGRSDEQWWRSVYKANEMSGGPYVTGWLTWLLPYVGQHRCAREGEVTTTPVPNPLLGALPSADRGVSHSDLPSAFSYVPFEWKYHEDELAYEFLAGLVGVREDPESLALEPVAGWAVRPKDAPQVSKY